MECDSSETNSSFSLKRLLNKQSSFSSKKRKTVLSLSRSNSSKSSSQQTEQSSQQSLGFQKTLSQPFNCNEKCIESNIATCLTDDTIKSETIDDTSQLTYDKVSTTQLEYSQEEEKIKELSDLEGLLNIKELPEADLVDSKDMNVLNNRNSILHETKTTTTTFEEYDCPICETSLTHVKVNYLRQKHVEDCLTKSVQAQQQFDTTIPQKDTNNNDFNHCLFCAKNLSHLKPESRQLHLNNCLDDANTIEKSKRESTFAGQRVPFMETLEICPICHETSPFTNCSIIQKISHTKKCAKQKKLTVPELLKKLQWIGWGYIPASSSNSELDNVPLLSEEISGLDNGNLLEPINHRQHCDLFSMAASFVDDTEHDTDFSTHVVIHKSNVSLLKSTTKDRQEDKMDEELQVALAVSKSMQTSHSSNCVKRKRGIKPADERDWNAANIWSMEESRVKSIEKLDMILFPTDQEEDEEMEKSNCDILGPSRVHVLWVKENNVLLEKERFSLWKLASNEENIWEQKDVFKALFLREIV